MLAKVVLLLEKICVHARVVNRCSMAAGKTVWTVDQYVGWALTTLVGAFIGSYLAGYLKKKGENLATHEDINRLVEQVRAVTEATKKIEAEISVGVWDKQKRWEMKREVLFEVARRLSEVEDALLGFAIVMRNDKKNQEAWATVAPSAEEQITWGRIRAERVEKWSNAQSAFEESRLFVGIVCGKDGKEAFEDLGTFINILARDISQKPEAYDTSRPDLIKKILAAQNAIRKELEVDT